MNDDVVNFRLAVEAILDADHALVEAPFRFVIPFIATLFSALLNCQFPFEHFYFQIVSCSSLILVRDGIV